MREGKSMDRDKGLGHRVEWSMLDPALLHPYLGADPDQASDPVSGVVRAGSRCDDMEALVLQIESATGASVRTDGGHLIVTPRSPGDAERTRQIVAVLLHS